MRIWHQDVNSLNEEELACLLYIVNHLFPCGIEITPKLIPSYKFKLLAKHVTNARPSLTEEGLPVYRSMCQKLRIPCENEVVKV